MRCQERGKSISENGMRSGLREDPSNTSPHSPLSQGLSQKQGWTHTNGLQEQSQNRETGTTDDPTNL